MPDHPADPSDPAVAALIRRKAARLARATGGPAADRDDLAQDLAAALLARRPKYDPARGDPGAFAHAVVGTAAADLLRGMRAGKRSPPAPSASAAEALPDPQAADRAGATDLALDLAAAIARLPADLRAVVDRLRTLTVAELAAERGVSRGWVYTRVRAARARFERDGLRAYLRESAARRPPAA